MQSPDSSDFHLVEEKATNMSSEMHPEHLFQQGWKRADWGNLPTTVLTDIFYLLDDKSRGRAGVVNKHWHNVYKTPRLWRKCHFRLHGSFRDERAIKYARTLGRYMRSGYITCGIHSDRFARRFQKSLTSYLHYLYNQRTQLEDLAFTRFELERYFRNQDIRSKLIRSLKRFLRIQRRLVYFDMTSCAMGELEGYQVLQALTNKCDATVQFLHLEDFFGSHISVYRSQEFVDVMSKFKTLKVINMNFNCLSNKLLLSLAETCGRTLKTLNIKCFRDDPYSQIIWGSSWGELKRACTNNLSVCICFDGVYAYEIVRRVLNPAIPLSHVDLYGDNEDDTFDPDITLRYLALNFNDTLQEIHLDVQPGSLEVGHGMLTLVKECKQLFQLEVKTMVVDLFSLHQMFLYIKDELVTRGERPRLEVFKLVINMMPLEYYEEMATIFQEFRDLFEENNLEYHFQGFDENGRAVAEV
ncbi:F-box only protein 39-like [Glandiceps talaboti]